MANNKKIAFSHRQKITFIVLPLLLLALFFIGLGQMMRLAAVESSLRSLASQNFINVVNRYYNTPLVIDPILKQSYIPELNLILPYSNEFTRDIRYDFVQDDIATKNGSVMVTTTSLLQQMTPASSASKVAFIGCQVPFELAIGTASSLNDGESIWNSILEDGRRIDVYKSTDQQCDKFTSSADGGTIVDILQRVKSY